MFNLHASGGLAMMQKTRTDVHKVCRTERLRRPIILGVTVLTSLSTHDLKHTGVAAGVEKQVRRASKTKTQRTKRQKARRHNKKRSRSHS